MMEVAAIKLSEVFRLVRKPKYVLGTTFTLSLAFFESVVFPLIDFSNLKSCLIISDLIGYQRALDEGAALRGASQDYLVVPAPVSDCFHPKVWLIIGEGEAVLLCGSGNLTQSGFMTNAELFDTIHISKEKPATGETITRLKSFLHGLKGMWSPVDSHNLLCVERLSLISDAVDDLPTTDSENQGPHFLHSFDGPLIEQLPAIPDAREIWVASPYFGNSLNGIELLTNRYPDSKLNVFPAVHHETTTDFPVHAFAKAYAYSPASILRVSGKKKGALTHLKLYGVVGADDTGWIYCTSANCTKAALQGTNVEAGIWREIKGPELANYFVAGEGELPEAKIPFEAKHQSTHSLHFCASEIGSRLEIIIAEKSFPQLPLRDVKLTLRAGSNLASIQLSELFVDKRSANLDLALFLTGKRRSKTAVCLELDGIDSSGNSVNGRGFVENHLVLTSDPLHRSAWRGVLGLLNEDGSLELADIAALLTLPTELIDGSLTPPSDGDGRGDKGTADSQAKPIGVAVWPPEPDLHDSHKGPIGRTSGQMRWFQRILETLLRNEKVDNDISDNSEDNSPSDGDDEKASSTVVTENKRVRTLAGKLWARTDDDYERLYDRLLRLVPTELNARNIWPAAICAFLSTMAIFQKVRPMLSDRELRIDAGMLCDDFIRIMLKERQQHADFCCPKGYRYRHEKFPSLADDLKKEFKVELHFDFATVMLALIVDSKLRSSIGNYPQFGRQHLSQITGTGLSFDQCTIDTTLNIWRRYLRDSRRKFADTNFLTAFQELCATKLQSSH